jgi:hypothetical protein
MPVPTASSKQTRTRRVLCLSVLASLTCAALGLAPAAGAANLVANPSFEETPFIWTQTGSGIDVIGSPAYQIQDGALAVDLNSSAKGGIQQPLANTVAGTHYDLTYWMAANAYSPSFCALGPPKPIYTMNVLWNNTVVEGASFNPNGTFGGEPLSQANMGWVKHSVSVVGTGSDSLAFSSTNPEGACGPTVDNVGIDLAGPAAPVVTKLSTKVAVAAGGTPVTITGKNFTGATSVQFGSTSAVSFVFKSATTISAVSPAGTARPVDVTVTTPNGTSAVSSADHLKIGPPTVTNVSPGSGPKESGGTAVIVTGTGFGLGTEATLFKFGAIEATTVNCTSITACIVDVPSAAAATVDVKATVSGMSSLKSVPADQYKYE